MTTFAVMNLLIGLIVNAMQGATEDDKADEKAAFEDKVLARLEAIEESLGEKRGK